jgi:hypothetical protein
LAAALIASALGFATVGCGGGSLQDPAGNFNPGDHGQSPGPDWNNDDIDQDPNGTYPAISEDFQIQGHSGTYQRSGINTDSRLLVTVRAGFPTVIPGTGFTAGFSCVRYRVRVGSKTMTAFVTNSGQNVTFGPCAGARTFVTLDFSDQLYPGHPAMTVRISSPEYDNCRLYGNVYGSGCPITAVYSTHVVTGSIEVQTDITY